MNRNADDRRKRAEQLFHLLMDLAVAEQRRILDAEAADEPELRAEVEALLRADTAENSSVETIGVVKTVTTPKVIDKYHLLQPIGEGGFGSVWLAEQREPVKRRVALKIIKLGMDTKQVIARFEAERQALALMDHPNIAKVLDAGSTEQGRPYFVMEYIAGIPLTQFCDQEQLDLDERLDLFGKVCQAIQHAHQKGMIHRDIKPSNVLVTLHDGVPVPKVIDFGIAKATNLELTNKTFFTEHKQMIGTPAYMSPEQAEMSGLGIDTRSDIYSLGVLLYELLTGTTPFDAKSLLEAGYAEMLRVIREQEPPKPSTRLSSLSATTSKRYRDSKAMWPRVRGDLDWIVMKCLEKDRGRRYATATGLFEDILRHLSDEPVLAGPPSTSYKVRKFMKRHRGPVLAVAAVAAMLVLAVVGTSYGLWKANQQQQIALASAADARKAQRTAEANAKEARAEAARAERLVEFQGEQLAEIDADGVGLSLRNGLREKLAAVAERRGLDEAAAAALLEAFDDMVAGADFTGLGLETLNTHIFQPTLRAIDKQFAEQPLDRARLLQAVAGVLRESGFLEQAVAPQREALRLRREVLGDEHPDTLMSVNNMWGLLAAQGMLTEAEPYLREALETSRQALGDEHPTTLTLIANLGRLLESLGRLAEAERFSNEALEGRRRVLGNEHPDTLTSLNNMGVLLEAQGKLPEAERYLREALDTSRRVKGNTHRLTLMIMNSLGGLLDSRGRLAEADHYYREVLEYSRQELGNEHPQTLMSINNMGFLLVRQGKLGEAERYFREALKGNRRVLGNEHPQTLASISNMGGLLQTKGKLDEAERYFGEALEISRRVLGDEHPSTLISINNMGNLLRVQGKLDEAEALSREALETQRRVLGDEHPDTLIGINNMGRLLQDQVKLAEAEPYYREALETHRRVLGDEHPHTLESINNLAVLLHSLDKLNEARPYFREALETSRRVLGDAHPSTLRKIINWGALLEAEGKLSEAELHYREALDGVRMALGNEHPDTLATINNIGSLLVRQGRLDEAKPYLHEALEVSRRVLGDEHPDTLGSINNMGALLRDQGKLIEALDVLLPGAKSAEATLSPQHPVYKALVEKVVHVARALHETDPDAGYDAIADEWAAKLEAVTER